MDKAAFGEYVHDLENEAAGIGLKSGWVPATKYILVNDQGEYVGIVNLRHELNDALMEGAGHIGYGIAPEWRGRGYATEGLRLLLIKARDEFDITEAYLSVHKTIPPRWRCSVISAPVSITSRTLSISRASTLRPLPKLQETIFATVHLAEALHVVPQMITPSQWSISCWMICAVKPVNVACRSRQRRSM